MKNKITIAIEFAPLESHGHRIMNEAFYIETNNREDAQRIYLELLSFASALQKLAEKFDDTTDK